MEVLIIELKSSFFVDFTLCITPPFSVKIITCKRKTSLGPPKILSRSSPWMEFRCFYMVSICRMGVRVNMRQVRMALKWRQSMDAFIAGWSTTKYMAGQEDPVSRCCKQYENYLVKLKMTK
jgi:hypothetical protein